jgi:diacylglycerol kinase (ATP)
MKKADYNLLWSFYYAFSGIFYAVFHERNLRIHFAAAAAALYFSRYYGLSRGEYALLLLVIGFVVTSELMNTAIERTVDLESPAFSPLAKIAKDVAAGAVLVSGITAAVVAFLFFWDIPTLGLILADLLAAPVLWAALLAAAFLWVFLPFGRKRGTK